ncbi:carboxypeptidase B2 isoform X2 [Corvus cornix cornix]|uniref:carboxypeptidase B2 isoform X2 n=1 Tax=Corvus brachyrhynchos TaxID=85066 RepID=UPI0004DE0BB7|nr:PREDICTED: carboxypeptidase B2 isoform X2 [Corvus brachyrhynchos]XP_010398754.1 carboxypeptidase B2 isoform X2 [Corvus cornix cornix]XP_031955665.1 carboxypeptidase B2 isoform X2 [Corvus moneduloides]XP_041870109.1 carboxypeptidase B2 isoform X2 [Corvus kubaryi]XP_048151703.1 carboxypeptidase B2 isoform X2 [Corvus hawaiiensis]
MKFYLLFFTLFILVQEKHVFTIPRDEVLWALPQTDEQVEALQDLLNTTEVILWQPVVVENIKKDREVHFYVRASNINSIKAQLRQLTIQHKVLIEDVQGIIEKQIVNDTVNARGSSSYYENYHSMKEIYHWMEQVVKVHSDLLQKIYIGSSYEKRPLYVLKISKSKEKSKNAIWIDCGIHAREWISPAFCLWFIGHAIHVRERDQTMTTLLEHFDFYIMPVINVDGYEYTWSHPSNRLWRKSRSAHGNSKCIGTDMNRNFDAHWCGTGASHYECHETYCGPYPESEPEVKAVARFVRDHKDTIKAYITMHSYSQLVLFPYSYTMNKSKDHEELESLAQKAAKAIKRTTWKTYRPGAGAQTIYLAPGGSDDWAYDLGIKYSFTFELRDTGTYGFLLPSREIKPTCLEALSAVKVIAQHVLQNL